MTTGSIAGRWLFDAPLSGDTELIEYGMAIIVAAFLPLCQWRRANIIVDFFTTRLSAHGRQRLDRLGALMIAAMMTLITWRTAVGALDQKSVGATTMLLQWPEWLAYAAAAGVDRGDRAVHGCHRPQRPARPAGIVTWAR